MTTKQIERRSFPAQFEVRSNPDGTIGVRGYAAVFGQVAYGERIHPGAFNRTLAQRDDVRLLVNHDGVALARTKSGTLLLGVDEVGEWFDAPSLDPANPDVQRLVSAMSRKDIDQCSFAGYFLDVQTVDGVREVREVQQCDVSIVTYPWYDETTAGLTGDREVDRAVLCLRSLTPEQRAAAEALAEAATGPSDALRALRAAPPGKSSFGDLAIAILDAVEAMIEAATGQAPWWLWLEDFGTDWAVYCMYNDGEDSYFQVPYSGDVAGITLGAPFPVEIVVEYRPVVSSENDPTSEQRSPLSIAEARALLGLSPAA